MSANWRVRASRLDRIVSDVPRARARVAAAQSREVLPGETTGDSSWL
jgi:hypothetical protein